jgi:ADP-ribosylglycohydrolase
VVDPEQIAGRFVAWYRARKLSGLGASTLKALQELDAGAHWALAGAKGERAAGNGAAMRVAPLAFVLDLECDDDRRTLRDVCRITHHHDEAYLGALALVHAIQLACDELFDARRLLQEIAARLPDSQVRDRLLQIAALTSDLSIAAAAAQFGNSGFVVDTVPLAIFAAGRIHSESFQDVVQQAMNAGGDTDSLGSMTGQIAGARVGIHGIRPTTIERLTQGAEILVVAEAFAEALDRRFTER